MRADQTRAWFGGAKRLTGLTAKTKIHPHEARLWQVQCGVGLNVPLDLPDGTERALGRGAMLVVQNIGAGGDGSFEFLDSAEEPMVFADGSKQLDPGLWAKLFVRSFDGSGFPIWTIVRLPGGARSILT